MRPGAAATTPPLAGAAPAWRRVSATARATGTAVAASAVALALTAVLQRPLEGPFFFPSLAATVIVALHVGRGAALVTLALSTVGHAVLFLEPRGALAIARPSELARLVAWAGTTFAVLVLVARARAASAAEREASRRLALGVASERRARELYQCLQAVTVACSAARTFSEVAFALMESALAQLRPSTVSLATVDAGGALRIVFSQGIPEPELDRLHAVRPEAALPSAECARTRRIVVVSGGERIDRRYPALAALRLNLGLESLASIPIEAAGELQGVLGLGFADARVLDEEDQQFLLALADQAGQAIARARSYDAEARARAEAEQTLRVKEQLLAVVGHDLRNPLATIVNGANVLFRRGTLAPNDAATLRRMASSADRMSAVIGDLLDFSRVRQGLGIPVQPAPVDLGELAREVLAEFEDQPRASALALRASGDLRIVADRQRLAQVLSNLVGNALHHGAGAEVGVDLAAGDGDVVLRVHNAGCIDPEVLPHVFEPFRRGRAGAGATPDPRSVGLGLFIVQAIVKAHGGAVAVASSQERGTTFEVTLPRDRTT